MDETSGPASRVAVEPVTYRQMASGRARRWTCRGPGRSLSAWRFPVATECRLLCDLATLEEAIYIGVLKIGEILFPFFSSLQGEGDQRVGDLFFRAAWVLNVLAVSVLGALIPVAGNVLHLWTGAEVAAEGQRVLIVLAVAGILGSGTNVFAFYLLANGRTRTNAVISAVTALFTLATSAIVLPYVGWPAAGWSSCAGALAQIVAMTLLLRRSFDLPDMWPRVWHFVLMPIGLGVACAILLRVWSVGYGFDQNIIWWQVVGGYGLSAAVILAVVIAVSTVGLMGRFAGAICNALRHE